MRNKMKSITAIAVAAALVVACGDAEELDHTPEESAEEVVEVEVDSTEEEESPSPEPEENEEEESPGSGDDGDLAIGDTAELGDYEVTVTEFVADATESVLSDNEFNDDPENGLYATVTFDATYIGDDEGMPGFDLAAKIVIDGVQHADSECLAVVEGGGFDAPTLENGGTATGITFCFDYPGLNDGARLFFEELMSFNNERAYWSVNG